MKKNVLIFNCFVLLFSTLSFNLKGQCRNTCVDPALLDVYVNRFIESDNELYKQDIPNMDARQFLEKNIPLFECPDKQMEETYYFRWWTYRKHIKRTAEGYVVSEFLPDVPWAGKYNTISCAAAHHFYEGRWLQDGSILADYAQFWFVGGGNPRLYSFWAADAILNYYKVHPDKKLIIKLYPYLKANFSEWEVEKRDSTALFWQIDDRDGMEMSVSGRLSEGGRGYRPTINSYMYGEAVALSEMASLLGNESDFSFFQKKAKELKELVNTRLWNKSDRFYEVIPYNGKNEFSAVRELNGYTPWYFNIPLPAYSEAWSQLMDPKGFLATYGPTTVEQRSPDFRLSYEGHECQWNGPSWPYSTSITLVALANLLNNYSQSYVTADDYMTILRQYSVSHQLKKENGTCIPWIDENLNPYTGDWISRTRLKDWNNGTWDQSKGGEERGKDYNHSSFCDLIISGLIGIRPQMNDVLLVNPLIPEGMWDYFCLDNLLYKSHKITVLYDRFGTRYKKGKGFMIYVDGVLARKSDQICQLEVTL